MPCLGYVVGAPGERMLGGVPWCFNALGDLGRRSSLGPRCVFQWLATWSKGPCLGGPWAAGPDPSACANPRVARKDERLRVV